MEVDRGNRLFFRLLTHVAAEKKWLRIWLLTVNGRPAAFEYHLRYNGDEIAMRSDFDERLRDSSPGSNLDAYVVQRLFQEGVRKYDMGGNCDSYKLRWTDSYRPHTCFYLFGTHAYARLLYLVDVSLVESLKRFPGVSDLAEQVRKLARGLVKFRP